MVKTQATLNWNLRIVCLRYVNYVEWYLFRSFFTDRQWKKLLNVEISFLMIYVALKWRHNERDGVSNHRRLDGLLNCLFRSKKTSNLRVLGLCEGNSPVTDEFPSQKATNTENASIWWRHHDRG